MKKKTVVVKKSVNLNCNYVLTAYDGTSCVKQKSFDKKPTYEDITQFIEDENASYCTLEERYFTTDDAVDPFDDDEDDWDEDDWDV